MFTTGSVLTYLNMMSGGAMSRCTIFALGVQPYINATIIIQLLCVAIPYLENTSKEGEEGRQKLTKISNYTVAIALLLSIAYYFIIRRMGALKYTDGFAGIFSGTLSWPASAAGAQFVTWMGNQIDAKGIGNGLSLMILPVSWLTGPAWLFLSGYARPYGWCFRLLHYDPRHGHSGPCCCGLCSDPDQR